MLLASVEYARPRSLDEALSLLAADPNARALAVGQTLINVMKARIAAPELLVFFFSSRRRHTRCSRDWSSDVCSSDLSIRQAAAQVEAVVRRGTEDAPKGLQ